MKITRLILIFGLTIAALSALLVGANLVHAGVDSGVVTTCDDAHLTTAVSGGGLVTFNCGSATLTITSDHILAADTTIDGSNNGHPLTITASGVSFPFYVNPGKMLTLTNVVIANVSGTNSGAVNAQGSLVISNSKFISNNGGVINANGGLTVTNSLFQTNAGAYAIAITTNGFGNVSHSQFISNTNGAIYTKSSLTVNDSQFYSNTIGAAGAGAGIYAYAWVHPQLILNIISSQFLTNTAYYGGGIAADGGVVVVSNTLLVSNTARTTGGGMWYETLNAGDGLQILSSTIRNNYGGGVDVNGGGGAPMVLANSLIQDNYAPGSTGGVGAGGMFITVTQSIFNNNRTPANNFPGGLSAGGPAYITGSVFYNNSGPHSGGAYLGNGGLPTFTDTVANTSFYSNTSTTYEGGALSALVPLIMADTVISHNVSVLSDGGGLYWWSNGNNLSVARSLIYDNRALGSTYGGGVYVHGNATIVNSTIYSNSAYNTGGILLSNSSSLTLTNDTVVNNTATNSNATGNLNGGSLTPMALVNTIVSGGNPINCTGQITSLGHNLTSDSACFVATTGDLVNTNPQLGPLQDNGGPSWTLMPLAGSPVVNAGSNVSCPSADQRGVARPIGSRCDIGAVESPYTSTLVGQTITFNALPDKLLTDPPFTITATASSGLSVTFASLTTNVCSVGGDLVTLLHTGTCTVRASQAGNATYAAAPDVDRSFLVTGWSLYLPLVIR